MANLRTKKQAPKSGNNEHSKSVSRYKGHNRCVLMQSPTDVLFSKVLAGTEGYQNIGVDITQQPLAQWDTRLMGSRK